MNKFLKLTKFQSKSFSQYIPYAKIKFKEHGFHEKTSLIYEINENRVKQMKIPNILIKSLSPVSFTLLFSPIETFYSYGLIGLINFLVFRQFSLIKQRNNTSVKSIYLLKNGAQIVILTWDNSVNVLNIKDIRIQQINNQILISTFDKEFFLNLNEDLDNLNFELFEAIKQLKNINTRFNRHNYNRLTLPKYYYSI